MRKILSALKNCFPILQSNFFSFAVKLKISEKPAKCIINNRKIDSSWKLFPNFFSFRANQTENKNGTLLARKRKEKKFEASLLQQLCFRGKKVRNVVRWAEFHNLYEFLLYSHQFHRNCILENSSDGILWSERERTRKIQEK